MNGSLTINYKNLKVDIDNKLCYLNGEAISLSKKEFEILVFLLNNSNKVYSREELLKMFWKDNVSIRSVDTTISRLRKKLQEYGNYIITRQGYGYSFLKNE